MSRKPVHGVERSRTRLPDGHVVHAWHFPHPAGPLVVVVHGLGAASEALLPVARELARDFEVHVPDLPGYGLSTGAGPVVTPAEHADALAAWLRALGLPPSTLLGNSAGCQTLLHLAVRHPDRVDRLVLQGPTMDERHRTAPRQLLRFVLDAPFERPTLGLVQIRGVRQAGVRPLWRRFRAALDDRPEELLPEVVCPVLVVRGGLDPIVPRRWAARVGRLAPDGRLVTVFAGSHAMVYSRPRRLARVVRGFVAHLSQREWPHSERAGTR